jgi:anti-anti-sigma factor
MQIERFITDGVLILAPAGRVDSTTAAALDDALRPASDERRLIVDLSGVEYMSSAGLRVLLVVAKRTRASAGQLVLCGLTDPVRQVFELAGFLPLFTVEPSRDRAIARLNTPV